MKKWIVFLLGSVLALAALAAVGRASYHAGFAQGARSVAQNTGERTPDLPLFPGSGRGFSMQVPDFRDKGVDFHGFDRGHPGFPPFLPFRGLIRIAFLALLLLGAYVLFRKSGWRFVQIDLPMQIASTNEQVVKKKKKSTS